MACLGRIAPHDKDTVCKMPMGPKRSSDSVRSVYDRAETVLRDDGIRNYTNRNCLAYEQSCTAGNGHDMRHGIGSETLYCGVVAAYLSSETWRSCDIVTGW